MLQTLKGRIALILAVVALSVWFLIDRGIILGLDLQGGTHLALEVDDPTGALGPEQRADAIDRALTVVRSRVDELGVTEPVIQKVGDDRIIVEIAGAGEAQQQRAKEVIQQTAFLQFQIVQPISDLQAVLPRIDRAIVDALGAEAVAAEEPQIAPGVGGLFQTAPDSGTAADTADAATTAAPLSSKLVPYGGGSGAQLAVAAEDVPEVERYLALPAVQRLLPRGSEFAWGQVPTGPDAAQFRELYLLDSDPLITGEYLEDAQAQPDPMFGRPMVTFQMSRRGGRIFGRGTGANVGNQMAIVLDERVYSAPVINDQIEASGQIDLGGASIEEARDLALVLRAGALPVPIRIVEERTVGPSLGQDSVDSGRIAGIIGVVLVIVLMIAYYRLAGALAVVALGVYLLMIVGALAALGATLTLPGIAGLVLSIGMAVDANVLIFERIREELAAGRSARIAVNEGFSNALSAIVDSNITTLITAGVLFYVGTGPVRGFAVTLSIGIIASMFTAIFVTRTLFMLYLERRSGSQALSI